VLLVGGGRVHRHRQAAQLLHKRLLARDALLQRPGHRQQPHAQQRTDAGAQHAVRHEVQLDDAHERRKRAVKQRAEAERVVHKGVDAREQREQVVEQRHGCVVLVGAACACGLLSSV
jgi:hypothetical protein